MIRGLRGEEEFIFERSGSDPLPRMRAESTRALDLAHEDVRKVRRFSRHAKLETFLKI